MRVNTRDVFRRYGAALLIVALAATLLDLPEIGGGPESEFLVCVLAIMTAAWQGGLGPGFMATVLIAWFTWPPPNQPGQMVGVAVVLVVGLWISLLTGRLHAARRRAEDAGARVRRSEAQMQAILDHSPAAIFTKDLQGRYLMVNRLWCELIGVSESEALGKTIESFLPADVAVTLHKHDREALESGAPLQREEVVPNTKGLHTFLSLKFPLRDAVGQPYALCGIATEITDRKRDEAAVQEARELAETANRAKDRFLAMLSHELRTPLSPALMEVSALLEQDEIAPDLRASLERVHRNIALEAGLIDDLLDVVRVEHGKLHLHLEPVDAHLVVERALEICASDLENANVQPRVALSARNHHVQGDPARLLQVFWNLFKNAVKFTPPGGTLTIRSRNDEGDRLMIEVVDSGLGISPEALRRIFDAFDQGDAPSTRRAGGLGLGLAISRAVVEAHGGVLTATSAGEGRGTTFQIELTTVAAPAPAVPVAASRPSPPADRASWNGSERPPARILLVEDDADTRIVLSKLLERRGYRVHAADCLSRALELAATEGFDVLISDLSLPDGSGLDLIGELSRHGTVRGIALSGYGSGVDVQASLDAGFLMHLTKPVNFHQIIDAIESAQGPGGGLAPPHSHSRHSNTALNS